MMILRHPKAGKKIRPRGENVAFRPAVAHQNAVTEEEDLIGRKEEIVVRPTGQKEEIVAILIGPKGETDEAMTDLNEEVRTCRNAVNGLPILITSKLFYQNCY